MNQPYIKLMPTRHKEKAYPTLGQLKQGDRFWFGEDERDPPHTRTDTGFLTPDFFHCEPSTWDIEVNPEDKDSMSDRIKPVPLTHLPVGHLFQRDCYYPHGMIYLKTGPERGVVVSEGYHYGVDVHLDPECVVIDGGQLTVEWRDM